MASQWPQHYQAPEGYDYNQYSQQNAQQPPQQYAQQSQQYAQQYAQQPQQYFQQQQHYNQQQPQPSPHPNARPPSYQYPQQPAQPHYPHQQSTHQGGQYSNQYPAPASAAYVPPDHTQAVQQGCYNCGNASHWAQNCPEPKRELPASSGAYSRPPPFKRQKPNPPVVTKYALPPHVQQAQGQPSYHYGTRYSAPSYTQYQAAQGPPTPMSGQSPLHPQWQQQPYPQQYHQSYPQQQQYTQPYQHAGYQQHPQPYVQTAPATPATPYGPQYAHSGSPQVAQANAVTYFQNGQYQQRPDLQAQSMANASPVPAVSQTASYLQKRHSVSNVAQAQPASNASPISAASQTVPHQSHYTASDAPETAHVHKGSRNSSVSMRSMSVTPKHQSVQPAEGDDEDEDLAKMDIPDIPTVIDGSFASLVDRPLPANFIVADALEPFDPPKLENDGRCQSKYVVIDSSSTFHLCIKDTKYWDDMKNDPVFHPIHESSKVVSLDIIMATYRPRDIRDERDHVETEDGEWTQHTGAHHDKGPDLMERLEHALDAGRTTETPVPVPRNTSWDRTPRKKSFPFSKTNPPSEDAIAPRGIDGPYRPHHHTAWPCPPPPAEESPAASPERTPPMRSRTPSMYELNELYQQEHGTRPGATASDTSSTTPGKSTKRPAKVSLDPFEPPPPPAHLRKAASYDGANEDGLTAGSLNGHVNGNSHSNGNGRSYSNDDSVSPTRVRSDAINGRKRDYDHGALSEDDNTPKRRQADDTKSKLKKRSQPKVAAAYR
ncbi:MAG: hypothetical protein L6R35_004355 [Caloplaca aegaea]|nr:MAG: hypothetical protein L6R35_004355 [Caloplaca aegaea]